jgi:hypothetical protein
MPATYEPIASTTLTSSGTITFTSIPQTYTDLVLVTNLIGASTADLDITLNGNTGSNYSWTVLYSSGSTISSSRISNFAAMRLDYYGYIGTTFGQMNVANFINYSNTSTFKTVIARANNGDYGVDAMACLWRSTAAITTIAITNTLSAGSTASLYGIKAA